jgi:heme oxygenase (biliverdin-IX-beta and delta-forming)
MLATLRAATRADHAALEREMDLLRPPLERDRFVHALQVFYGFHLAWEPRVASLIDDEALLAGRQRLSLIQRDLARLGAAPEASNVFDLDDVGSRSAAWGSLYVMEGSTLGGQLIAKALRSHAAWAPAEGLGYFDPHGPRTVAMWRALCSALEAAAPSLDVDAATAAAQLTFRRLTQCFAGRWRAAA